MNLRPLAIDTLVLATLIFLLNLVFFPGDPGFLDLPVNPWILLAALLGARHGIAAGVAGAIIGSLGLWVSANLQGGTLVLSDLLAMPLRMVLTVWVVLGATVGAVLEADRSKNARKVATLDSLRTSEEALRSQNYLLESENSELRRKVLGATDTVSTIYDMARGLITLEGRDLYEACLELVERHTGATSSCLFLESSHQLQLVESRGVLPEGFQPNDPKSLPSRALHERRVLTLREAVEDQGCALAVPLVSPSRSEPIGVLVVGSIPLARLNAQTEKVLELLADWTARALDLVWRVQNLNDSEEEGALRRRLSESVLPPTALSTLTELGSLIVDPVLSLAAQKESSEIAQLNCAAVLQRLGPRAKIEEARWLKLMREPLERNVCIASQLKTLPMRRDLVGCKGLRKRLEWRASLGRRTMLLLIDGLAKALGDTAMGEALNGIHSPHPALRTEAIAVLGQRIGGRVDIALGLKAAPRYTGGREAVLEHLQSSHDPWTKKFALIAAGEIHRTLFLSRAEEALASADPLWIESALLGHAAGIKETQELEQEFVNHENPMVGETVATICRRPPNG